MQTNLIPIKDFLGLKTNSDESFTEFGGVLSCTNMAQYKPFRLQRIPGITDEINIAAADGKFLKSVVVWIAGVEYLYTVFSNGSNTVQIRNITNAVNTTGGSALTDTRAGALANIWTSTSYLGTEFIGNGVQVIQKITGAGTKIDITGTPTPPDGSLLKAYLGRLYVAGVSAVNGVAATDDDKSKAYYTDSLTETFDYANNFLNIAEIPGEVLSLAVNSPSSSAGTIQGELVLGKLNGLAKLTGDPGVSGGATMDIISSITGTEGPNSWVNTPVGLIFMGVSRGRRSIYFMPLGSQGEPKDIGQDLFDVLNDDTEILTNPRLSHAVYHDGFYKLFLSRGATPANVEVWLDINKFIRTQIIAWYGIHKRGLGEAPAVLSTGVLNAFGVVSAQGKHFTEKTDKTSTFLNTNGSTMIAELDLPLVVPSTPDEKVYDILNLQIAKEANVADNYITTEMFVEGVTEGDVNSLLIEDTTTTAGFQASVPLTGTNGASLAGHNARIKMQHTLNKRFDILKMDLQYLSHSRDKVRDDE